MAGIELTRPMSGCRVVTWQGEAHVFGQPPEVLKALLPRPPGALRTLVLPDTRERGGVLLNNLEFLLYYFLFFEGGLQEGRRLALVGEALHISHMLELLRLTLLGPSEEELRAWRTPPLVRREWLNASRYFALKDARGRVRQPSSFFDLVPFRDGEARVDGCTITHLGTDRFSFRAGNESVEVNLGEDAHIEPPYPVRVDYVPTGLTRFGIEVLGGASGFTPEEPSTGLALCHNGRYILIDSIPFIDQHLRARGISRNQISALFLTHLHDDHCNMFPLMLMPRPVDVITTREIFEMAMRKLAAGLGWKPEVVAEHFNFVELRLGRPLRYYGLEIDGHHTVHSIPTVGATFKASWQGRKRRVCVVGDIQTFAEIADMRAQGLVRESTERKLRSLYSRRFDLLVADGGMGPIHGDPADALGSRSERVVFVHVENLPERFNATFSLASAGKRYVVQDGDADIYTTQTIATLLRNFDSPLTRGWLATLLADTAIKRYNTDDVIIKQDSETWGDVFLILTGYCEVIHHDGREFRTLAVREAGELMGEMAVVTGRNLRNASVVARTPVLACQFSEETFNAFLEDVGLKASLLAWWARRPALARLPQFRGLGSSVIDSVARFAQDVVLEPGEQYVPELGWDLVYEGVIEGEDGTRHGPGAELGCWRPFARGRFEGGRALARTRIVRLPQAAMQEALRATPQLNYTLRRLRQGSLDPTAEPDWLLPEWPERHTHG